MGIIRVLVVMDGIEFYAESIFPVREPPLRVCFREMG